MKSFQVGNRVKSRYGIGTIIDEGSFVLAQYTVQMDDGRVFVMARWHLEHAN